MRQLPAPPDEQTEQRLQELLAPALEKQESLYRELGLRSRVLGLPVMVAIVVSMIWRQIGGGGTELARLLGMEGLLWVPVLAVSQQAISERLRTFPPQLFLEILRCILPVVAARWRQRTRPVSPVLQWAQTRYSAVLAVDGSTLDALMRKVGLLREEDVHPLAGKMLAILDVASRLPCHIWFDENPKAHDQRFWPQILPELPEGALLLLDKGFTNFKLFLHLEHVTFIGSPLGAAKENLNFTLRHCHRATPRLRDYLVQVGQGDECQLLRRVSIQFQGTWYIYLTNELRPSVLPPEARV